MPRGVYDRKKKDVMKPAEQKKKDEVHAMSSYTKKASVKSGMMASFGETTVKVQEKLPPRPRAELLR